MVTFEVNYLAVLVAAIAAMVVGFAWYAQGVFGKQWMALTGVKGKPDKSKMQQMMVGQLVLALIQAFVLANLVRIFGAVTLSDGLVVSFWAWLGFSATALGGNYIWGRKPLKLFWIDAGNYLLGLLVMGAILTLWR